MNAPSTCSLLVGALAVCFGCSTEPPRQVTNTANQAPVVDNATGEALQTVADEHAPPPLQFFLDETETVLNVLPPDVGPQPLDFPLPIVLVHGFSGFSDFGPLEYFYQVIDEFSEAGLEAFAPNQPPYASVQARAEILAGHIDQILDATGAQKVHLICHSQGGLDCRYIVSQMGYDAHVFDIITIATPHRGTPLADMASAAPDGIVNPAGMFMGWMLGFLEGDPPDESAWDNDEGSEQAWAADMVNAVASMTEEGTTLFNDNVPDHPEVPVYSVAGFSNLLGPQDLCDDGILFEKPDSVDSLDPLLVGPALAISGLDLRRNDGIVPTDSMRWGTFLGCIPADHFDQVGQIADTLPNLISGFDHMEFYWTLQAFLDGRELEYAAQFETDDQP